MEASSSLAKTSGYGARSNARSSSSSWKAVNVVRVFFFFATIVPSGFVTTALEEEDDFLLFLGPSDLEVAFVEDFTVCCSWRPTKGTFND